MTMTLLVLATVFAVSLVLTMAGLGGGLVYSPLFVLLGFATADAAASSLFLNMVAAASAAWVYARKGMVDFPLAVPLLVSSAATAPAGAYLNRHMDAQWFLLVMAAVLLAAAARMALGRPAAKEAPAASARAKMAWGVGVGLGIGVLGGLLGIGGGVFVVPVLVYALRVPVKTAAASTAFIVCFSSLTGFAGYAATGVVDWGFILPAAAACFLGGQIGSRIMAERLQGRTVSLLFAAVLVLMGLKLLQQALA